MEDIIFKYHLLRNQTMSTEEIGTFRFEGLNTSSNEIKVTKAVTSCGCTTVHYPKTVQAGETFFVTLNIDKRGMKGNFNQSCTLVYSNGQEFKLKVNGTIEQPDNQ